MAGRCRPDSRRRSHRSLIRSMLADSSVSSASTSRNAFTHSTATSGASRLRLGARTFASFHNRAFRAIHGSQA
jgi:hypothetical protein